jgi:nuclear protein localization family protein 4
MSENSPADEFAPEWFIVALACGLPTRPLTMLKNYDFPVENRGREITNQDVKSFLSRTKNIPSNVKYSNFHLLLYLAKALDRDVSST